MMQDGSCERQVCGVLSNSSRCNVSSGVITWYDTSVSGLYFLQVIVFSAIMLSLGYLTVNRNKSLVKSWFSYIDNIILILLAIFCFIPLTHIGDISQKRCMAFWPMVNTLYALYVSLLMTKTIFLQNLLNCKAPTDKCARRLAFVFLVAILHIIVLSSMTLKNPPTLRRYLCPTRGVITLCDVNGNMSVIISTSFNWFVIFFLCLLSLVEVVNNQDDFRRCRNQCILVLTVLLSYSISVFLNYFKFQLENYTLVTHLFYPIYMIIPIMGLTTFYIPTILHIIRCFNNQQRLKKISLTDKAEKRFLTNRLFSRKSYDPSRTWSWSEESALSFPSSLVRPEDAAVRVVAPLHTRQNVDLGNRWSYLGNTGKLVPAHWKEFFTRLSIEIPPAEEEFPTDARFTNQDIQHMQWCLPNLEATYV